MQSDNIMPMLLDSRDAENHQDNNVLQETRTNIASTNMFPFVLVPPQQAKRNKIRTRTILRSLQEQQEQPWCLQPRNHPEQFAHIFLNNLDSDNDNSDIDGDDSNQEGYDSDNAGDVDENSDDYLQNDKENMNRPPPSLPCLSPELCNRPSLSEFRTPNQKLLNDGVNKRNLAVPPLRPRFHGKSYCNANLMHMR